ncbi:hypothetical protein [Nocardia sp. NBC_01329]|uniref:hypothetical protein n=1 Tax=Nocardia sp. NBC_01329 TaxID=2903594 RepID=UPI002E1182AE|nr:hypothetical protein OG405_02255 [Nocardia sp. NBC_01329]
MSPRKSVRTVFFAVSAAAALCVGPVVLAAPMALAAPGEFPLDGRGGSESEPESSSPENDPGKRAENAGGGLATEVIDLSADMLKCGLSIATPAVKCPLGS